MPFFAPSVLQSKSIALSTGETITNARIVVNELVLSSVDDFLWYLTANGGTDWEQVSINESYSFTNTGNDLRYQIVGNPGATITIRQNNGDDYPIRVIYNE